MLDSANELEKAVEDLRRATQEREHLMGVRDDLIRAALKDGVTWTQVQKITGLGPHGVAMAIKRLTNE